MGKFLYRMAVLLLFLAASYTSDAQYDVNSFLDRGRYLLSEGKYARAIETLNSLVRIAPEMYDAYFLRGIAKYNLEDFNGAVSDFNRTISINPVYTPAYHYRSIAYSRMGMNEKAISDLETAVELRPGYVGLYFSRGVIYFLSRRFDDAVSDFTKYLAKVPDAADAYINRGTSYLFAGDTVKAMQDYTKAISLDYSDPEPYIRRSRVYASTGREDLAMEDLDTALNLDSLNTMALFSRSILRYGADDIKGALSDLDKVIEEEPGNSLSLYNRALIKSRIGDYASAVRDYDRVVRINPDNVLAYYNRASVLSMLGLYEEALSDYDKAIDLYPDFANAYMNRSYVKTELGMLSSAREDYDTARKKLQEYRYRSEKDPMYAEHFADTSGRFSRLLSFDADFAKKNFNNELLQDRSTAIRLKPMFRFVPSDERREVFALDNTYMSDALAAFMDSMPLPVELSEKASGVSEEYIRKLDDAFSGMHSAGAIDFLDAMVYADAGRFNDALSGYDRAVESNPDEGFYYLNRSVLKVETVEFISSVDSNIRVLSMNESSAVRSRVQDDRRAPADYSDAMEDMKKAADLLPGFPYARYNLGNLYCMTGMMPEAVREYDQAISEYPYFGEAYYNRGLVLIYLKDREKGCMDMSKAGELGVEEAYSVIKKYCEASPL